MSEFIVVLVTCGSEEEALKIAHALVEYHLAACVNLVSPIRSIYRWEGKVWDEKEWLLIIKTQAKRFVELEKRVKSLHSYAVPEIISLPIVEGSSPYLNWIMENTKQKLKGSRIQGARVRVKTERIIQKIENRIKGENKKIKPSNP